VWQPVEFFDGYLEKKELPTLYCKRKCEKKSYVKLKYVYDYSDFANICQPAVAPLKTTLIAQFVAKGQLISELLLDVFIWTKKRTKMFLYFCPTSKIGQIKKRIQIIILEDK
jgi:hypothetical protein